MKKYKNVIFEFRELYGLANEDYPDKLILKVLKENHFDYAKAFCALFS